MKHRNLKRLFSLVAVWIYVCCCAGCGKPNVQTNDQMDSLDQAEMKTIRILGVDLSAEDNNGNVIFLSDWIEDPECRMWNQLVEDLASRNICLDVDLVPEDQYFTVLQTKIVEGLDGYDWVFLGDKVDQETREYLIEQGMVVPVNDIWTNYSDGTAYTFYTRGDGVTLAKMRTHEDGNVYYLGNCAIDLYNGLKVSNPYGINIRYDWLKKLGLKTPQTTDELYEVLLAFQRKDVNGSGVRDEVVNTNLTSFENGFAQAFGLGHELVVFDPIAGEMTSPFYQENVKDYFTYMNKLYNAGLLDVSFDDSSEMQENKLSVITQDFVYAGNENRVSVLPEDDENAKWVPIMPVAENTPKYTCLLSWRNAPLEYYGVTSNADKEAIGVLLDYISTVEFDTLSFYGIENYSYELVDGAPVKLQTPLHSDAQVVVNSGALWASLFPSVQRVDYADMLSGMSNYPEKVSGCNKYYRNLEDYRVFYSPQTMMGIAEKEETEKLSRIAVDLDTYCEDLMLKLITGEKSVDDWDSYIYDLKKLGLDEMIELCQMRFERYLKENTQ